MQSEFAIIGISCYFPEVSDYTSFWHSLLNNSSIYTKSTSLDGEVNCRPEKGVIDHAEYFDPARFNISEKEAEIMDPQTRKFIELVEQGLEDSGYPRGRGLGKIGVIATQGTNHTYHNQITKHVARGELSGVNQLMENINKGADFLATRAAYIFDFTGPCFNLQSACSSSLVAIVEATYMLSAGRCDAVVVGGVHLSYPLEQGYLYESGSILSASGLCKPFDAEADGTIPSNGGGLIVLKPLAAAQAAGDRIHAVIAGANSNNDGGQKVSYAAPSTKGQYQLLKDTYKRTQLNISQLKFIECHATGTVVGDPIEVRAITQLMNESPKNNDHKIILGSVKGHIGHLFWSSGIASLIKAVESLKYGIYPGTANHLKTNPLLELNDKQIEITGANSTLTESDKAYAAVSSFGVGGTNAHVILARYGNTYQTVPQLQVKTYKLRYPNAKKYTLLTHDLGDEITPADAMIVPTSHLTTDQMITLFETALGETNLNPDSNYFDHYGDSISAITLIADIKRTFSIELTQDDIFNQPTPTLLTNFINQKIPATDTVKLNVSARDFNPYQKRFYLLEKLQRGIYSNYNVCICISIDEAFPKVVFSNELKNIISSIPAFAQRITWENDELYLAAPRDEILKIENIQLSDDINIQQELDNIFGRKFKLENGPICHLDFISHKKCEYLIINAPHLLLDGKGIENLLNAFNDKNTVNGTLRQDYLPKATELSLSQKSLDFWKKTLEHTHPTTLKVYSGEGVGRGNVRATIGAADCQTIKNNCEKLRTTPFVILYAVFNFYLSGVTGEKRLCTGTTLLNRDDATTNMIGCFVNNIPVVVDASEKHFSSILGATKKALAESLSHAQVPYDLIASQNNRSGAPLYNILFMLQNQTKAYELKFDGKIYYESAVAYSPLYGDLSINIVPIQKEFLLDVTYDKSKYSHVFITKFIEDYISRISSCLHKLENEAYVS
jgi:phthiocerol/phenolphthiocerol synthesis type-I polyketide synthase E